MYYSTTLAFKKAQLCRLEFVAIDQDAARDQDEIGTHCAGHANHQVAQLVRRRRRSVDGVAHCFNAIARMMEIGTCIEHETYTTLYR